MQWQGGDLRRKIERNLVWLEVEGCRQHSWWCKEDQHVVGGGNND